MLRSLLGIHFTSSGRISPRCYDSAQGFFNFSRERNIIFWQWSFKAKLCIAMGSRVYLLSASKTTLRKGIYPNHFRPTPTYCQGFAVTRQTCSNVHLYSVNFRSIYLPLNGHDRISVAIHRTTAVKSLRNFEHRVAPNIAKRSKYRYHAAKFESYRACYKFKTASLSIQIHRLERLPNQFTGHASTTIHSFLIVDRGEYISKRQGCCKSSCSPTQVDDERKAAEINTRTQPYLSLCAFR